MTFSMSDKYTVADDVMADGPRTDLRERFAASVTPYSTAMKAPTSRLIGSVSDRPDVATVAILGYN
ncbi:hypothetical protein FAZ95_07675 [Trinickia violacea]|uniref:Uncharacterized protein n=1 Tax=Trinickia violacea TaxID=2571746 RepID=A0A4P8IJT6_9BURK|nr:hypothetical protein [Trinickia violacea]QCP49072.1 hypothetical protein FAZ95_07675 [Trinickia violacea]